MTGLARHPLHFEVIDLGGSLSAALERRDSGFISLAEHQVCPTREVTDPLSMEDRITRAIAESRARKTLPHPAVRRALRVHTGLTQAIIGEAIGVSRPSAARYEAGIATPRGEVLLRYIDVLNLLAAEMASDSEMLDPACQPGRAETATPCRRDGF